MDNRDPNPLRLSSADNEAIELIVEQRLAERFEDESYHWRLRLVVIETILMAVLVATAGCLLGQPAVLVIRAAVLVAASCLATGLLLLSLSAGTAKLLARLRQRIGK